MTQLEDLLEKECEIQAQKDLESEARILELYKRLRTRHSWIYKFFRAVAWNPADVEELINETFARYLKDISATLFVTGGLDAAMAPIVEDGELIALTISGPAKPIEDLEKYTFTYPKAWFRRIAKSVRSDYIAKSVRAGERDESFQQAARFPIRHNGRSLYRSSSLLVEQLYSVHRTRDIEAWLVMRARNREIRERYLAALNKLGTVQKAAWILCRDELLARQQAEPLLVPLLHWRTARAALKARPIQDDEASRLLERLDVSPDVSKAKSKLAQELADLDPLRALKVPAPEWSREFLIGLTRSGHMRSLRPGASATQYSVTSYSVTSARDREFVRRIPPRYLHRPGIPINAARQGDRFWQDQQNKKTPSLEVVLGWFRAPVADVPEHTALIGKIRELRKLRRPWTTIAKQLNEAGFPSCYGAVWHSTGVLLFAERAGLLKRRAKQIAPQYVLDKIKSLLDDGRTCKSIAEELNTAKVRPSFGASWNAGDVRFIAEQARLTDPRPNYAVPKRAVNKIKTLLKVRKKWAAIAEELNAAKFRPPFGACWNADDVRFIAEQQGLTDSRRNSTAPKRVVYKIKALLKARKKWTAIAEELNAAHVRSGWGEPWYPSDVRLIAKRARLC